MALKVGINGFGRIGGALFRAGASDPNTEFVAIARERGALVLGIFDERSAQSGSSWPKSL